MIDASQWAKKIRQASADAIARDAEVDTGFVVRVEAVVREAQLDTVRQCLRLAQQQMNDARPLQRAALGKVVDALADLALDVEQRRRPVKGDG